MVLELKNLCKDFIVHTRGGVRVCGFKNISFGVEKGQFIALKGQSGSGKSSILKTIYRSYMPSRGQILLHTDNQSYDLCQLDDSNVLKVRKKHLSYISQFLHVLPRISALELVSAPLIEAGESQTIAIQRAKDMLTYFGIKEELFNLSPLTFSGGEQQRINIAKGIIAPKKVLLLDEPTASLDKENRQKVLDELQRLKKQGIAMIGIFHDQESMNAISDKIYEIGVIE